LLKLVAELLARALDTVLDRGVELGAGLLDAAILEATALLDAANELAIGVEDLLGCGVEPPPPPPQALSNRLKLRQLRPLRVSAKYDIFAPGLLFDHLIACLAESHDTTF